MASIRRNAGYAGDPYMAKAAENLAALFAPPSGADASGWANANATREKAARLAELYANPTDPNFDRRNIAVGNYAPTQSFYAQDQNNATTRRGQDVTAATSRYNTDATTSASILNNQNTVRGGAIANLYGALNQGQVRPEVPADVAATIGLPVLAQVAGAPKPLSTDEVAAIALQGAPPETQRGLALAGKGVQNVIGPDGKTVVESNAGALGQQPYIAPVAGAKPSNGQFVLPGGQRGAAVQDTASGRWRNAQTGEELPADAQITNLPTPQGSNADIGVGKTVSNDIDKQLIDIAVAKDTAVALRDKIATSPASQGVVGWMRGTAQNLVQTGGELGQFFGGQMASVSEAIKNGTADVGLAGAFDPNIPAIEMMANLLAFQYAKTTTGERLSNEMLKNAKAALGLEGLDANQANSLARINQAISRIEAQQGILTKARGGGTAAISGAASAPPAASPVAPSGRLRFDANGNPL
jgi:hypothetical protein